MEVWRRKRDCLYSLISFLVRSNEESTVWMALHQHDCRKGGWSLQVSDFAQGTRWPGRMTRSGGHWMEDLSFVVDIWWRCWISVEFERTSDSMVDTCMPVCGIVGQHGVLWLIESRAEKRIMAVLVQPRSLFLKFGSFELSLSTIPPLIFLWKWSTPYDLLTFWINWFPFSGQLGLSSVL